MSRTASATRKLVAAAPVFAALGDETRLQLVTRLSDGPQSTSQLTASTALTRQAVTKHLQALANAGLVRDTHAGRERLWELHPGGLDAARHTLDQLSAQWDVALGRLARMVETK